MHLTTYDVLTLVEIYGMFEMFISIMHRNPNFHSDERVHFICSGRQRRMLLTRKLNAHYVLWQTIVSYFKYRMLTKKSYFGSFGGEHLHIKALCMGNIKCPFKIESKGIQIDRDGL